MDSGEIHTRSDSEWEGDDLDEDLDDATQFSQASVANMQMPPPNRRPTRNHRQVPRRQTSDVIWTKNQNFEPRPSNCIRKNVEIDPRHGFTANSTPLEILNTILSDEIVEIIVTESNRFVSQVQQQNPKAFQKWKVLSAQEFKKFWALNLLMGIVEKPSVKDYWSKNQYMFTPIFSQVMSRNRFEEILRSIHFVNNETVDPNKKDRFNKLGELLPKIMEKFSELIKPGEYLCIDESLMPFSGRLGIQVYNPLKRARFGVKTMALVDCESKIMMKMLPYQGKTTALNSDDCDLGFGGRAAVTLLDQYLGQGYRLVVDNWYMSPKLAYHLLDHNTYVLGTVRKTRKNMPKIRKENGKLGKGCVETYNDGKILVERWMDRREVFMLNTFIAHEMTPTVAPNPKNTREKPQSVLVYNAKMGAVDDVDKQIRPYEAMRKSIKWYKKYAFYVLDLCVYNTYRVYLLLDQNRARPRYKQFLLDLINSIIVAQGVSLPRRPQEIVSVAKPHLPVCIRGSSGRKSYSNCWYCFNKLNGKRKQTCFKCLGCNRRFCIQNENSCFVLAHGNDTLVEIDEEELNDPVDVEGESNMENLRPVENSEHEPLDSNESISLLNNILFE